MIRLLKAEETYDLRSRILRPQQPVETYQYSEDNLETTFHIGLLLEEKIVANATFIQQTFPQFSEAQKPYRLRGMAVDTGLQSQGLGTQVLRAGLVELNNRQADMLWFNARTKAMSFYQRLGFLCVGDEFEIKGAGPHYVMYSWLKTY